MPLLQAAEAGVAYGNYIAWWKLLILFVVYLVWLRLISWMDKDATPARLPREAINGGALGALLLSLLLVLVLPMFALALVAVLLLLAVTVGGYLLWRKSTVGLDDLPAAFRAYLKETFTPKKKQGKPGQKKDEPTVAAGSVTLLDGRGNKPPVPDDDDPLHAGYQAAHRLLVEPLEQHAERIQLVQIAPRPDAEGNMQDRYGSKYTVDGVDHPGQAVPAAEGIAAVDYLKDLAKLDREERRKVQKGKLMARTSDGARELGLQTRGTRAGETLTLEVDEKSRYQQRLTQLGMTPPQREVVDAFIRGDGFENGRIAIISAPEGGGLDAIKYGVLAEHDAFTQHILTAERRVERDLEGITQQPIGEDPKEHAKQISWLADQQPNVLLVERAAGKAAAAEVLRYAQEDGNVGYVALRAANTAEAAAGWIKQCGDAKAALKPVGLILSGRYFRKLCDACKIQYEPADAVLAKLGVPKGKVRELYKARTEPMLDQRGNPVTCNFCGGLGYRGRVGAFEILPVDATVRKQLAMDPSPGAVRNLLRAKKLLTLNDAAIRQVVAGRTDLSEVQRVLSQDGGTAKRPPTPAA
jgi:type II secretory ATPase GspE/PulE/Tfp pilus assembly ATPase PilB-like protein